MFISSNSSMISVRAAFGALLLALAGCGGGEPTPPPEGSKSSAAVPVLVPLRSESMRAPQAAVTPTESAIAQLFNFAQNVYRDYFPTQLLSITMPPFVYRFYPQTGIYLGVAKNVPAGSEYAEGGVYVMGGPFGSSPKPLGALTDFVTPRPLTGSWMAFAEGNPGIPGDGNVVRFSNVTRAYELVMPVPLDELWNGATVAGFTPPGEQRPAKIEVHFRTIAPLGDICRFEFWSVAGNGVALDVGGAPGFANSFAPANAGWWLDYVNNNAAPRRNCMRTFSSSEIEMWAIRPSLGTTYPAVDAVWLALSSDMPPSGQSAGANEFLIFPLTLPEYSDGAFSRNTINSVVDHSMSTPYSHRDGRILTFTGELFQAHGIYPAGSNTLRQACYPKVDAAWSSLLLTIYKGTTGSGHNNCTAGEALNYEAHPGYDYWAPMYTPVRSAAAGVVVDSASSTSLADADRRCIPKGLSAGCAAWGAVGIDHGNGYVTQYLHMDSIDVVAGQQVPEGVQIGKSGATAPGGIAQHFHFEVLKRRSSATSPTDYRPEVWATVDPYGFDSSAGQPDYLSTVNGVINVCLWKNGCRYQ